MRRIESADGIERRGRVLALLLLHSSRSATTRRSTSARAGPCPGARASSRASTEMLEEAVAAGDKALVFTQFREMGDRLGRPPAVASSASRSRSCTAARRGRRATRWCAASRRSRTGRAIFVLSRQGGRHRPQPHRREPRLPLRPLVEPGRRGPGDRPRLPHRPEARRAGPQARLRRHGRGEDRPAARAEARPRREGRRRRRELDHRARQRRAARSLLPRSRMPRSAATTKRTTTATPDPVAARASRPRAHGGGARMSRWNDWGWYTPAPKQPAARARHQDEEGRLDLVGPALGRGARNDVARLLQPSRARADVRPRRSHPRPRGQGRRGHGEGHRLARRRPTRSASRWRSCPRPTWTQGHRGDGREGAVRGRAARRADAAGDRRRVQAQRARACFRRSEADLRRAAAAPTGPTRASTWRPPTTCSARRSIAIRSCSSSCADGPRSRCSRRCVPREPLPATSRRRRGRAKRTRDGRRR